MYRDNVSPASILIVKTSSLGDIIQAFNVLDDLKNRFPKVSIDWAVEAKFYPVVSSHPLVRRAIPLEIKGKKNIFPGLRNLRKERYDLVFDLQGNTKSGVITMLSRAKKKVGFGLKTVREWPNILATNVRFEISKEKNIRLFYLELIEKFFTVQSSKDFEGVRFKVTEEEKSQVDQIVAKVPGEKKIMVCPGSKWPNKQLKKETFLTFLQKIEEEYRASFLLVWGSAEEKELAKFLSKHLKVSYVVDKLPINMWQNLMNETDLVIAVDSSALHLCGTTLAPSFSVFGPTSFETFKPIGSRHTGLQGRCPYGQVFVKQCPLLRSCMTGACMKDLKVVELFQAFQNQCDFLRLEQPL